MCAAIATMSVSEAIAPHLPFLRRYARAVTGSQSSGDQFVVATLEAVIARPDIINVADAPRVDLYRALHVIWRTASPSDPSADQSRDTSLEHSLATLSPVERQALLLFSMEEFNYAEVARILDTSKEHATSLIDHAVEEMSKQARSRVLIIEDEPIIAMDLQGIVEGLDHQVVATADTRERAVEAAMKHRPDLVLADIQLADGSSGIDAVQEILAEFDVPVVFITAYPDRLLTGARPEPTFLITKPFREEGVEATICQALFFRSAPAELVN